MVYPVIHCVPLHQGGLQHALTNAQIALENNADGIFLIGHNVESVDMVHIYNYVRSKCSILWIGINFLDISVNRDPKSMQSLVQECEGLSALWMDEMPNNDYGLGVCTFAGVAFKYINANQSGDALAQACKQALQRCDIVTTSGNKTGSPPDLEKLATIRRHIGQRKLAIASGVSAENVYEMKPYADIFLVASSITRFGDTSNDHEFLVPEKVRKLADIVHK